MVCMLVPTVSPHSESRLPCRAWELVLAPIGMASSPGVALPLHLSQSCAQHAHSQEDAGTVVTGLVGQAM